MSSDENLRERAGHAVPHADNWDSMYSGDQEAQIDAWIDGYNAARLPNVRRARHFARMTRTDFDGKLCAADERSPNWGAKPIGEASRSNDGED